MELSNAKTATQLLETLSNSSNTPSLQCAGTPTVKTDLTLNL